MDMLIAYRVRKCDLPGMQQQPAALELRAKERVLLAIAVGRIADDRMEDMFQMTPYLVHASGAGGHGDERIAGGRISAHGMGQLDGRETPVFRNRLPGGPLGICSTVGHPVPHLLQGMIDAARIIGEPPHHGTIGLCDPAVGDDLGHAAGYLLVQGEDENAGRGLVEPVERIDPSAKLVPQDLHGIPGLPAVDEAAMDQEAGGFVHRDQVLILIQNG